MKIDAQIKGDWAAPQCQFTLDINFQLGIQQNHGSLVAPTQHGTAYCQVKVHWVGQFICVCEKIFLWITVTNDNMPLMRMLLSGRQIFDWSKMPPMEMLERRKCIV
jgi:hypothetical protein